MFHSQFYDVFSREISEQIRTRITVEIEFLIRTYDIMIGKMWKTNHRRGIVTLTLYFHDGLVEINVGKLVTVLCVPAKTIGDRVVIWCFTFR